MRAGTLRYGGCPAMGRRAATAVIAVLLALAGLTAAPAPANAAADVVRSQQWQLDFLRAGQAWQYSTGAGVTVAVIDSGVDATHPDLRGKVLPGADFVDGSTDGRTDVVGHGTAVAALIAGRGDDQRGVKGLAYNARILPVRVLDPQNEYDSAETVARAVRWVVDQGVPVINLSLGSAETSPVLTEALRYAFDHDVVVVACDGNLSNARGSQVWHPAREPGVVAVSGVVRSGGFWSGSLRGPETVLAAPAAGLTAASRDHGYARVQGTSFGAPLVAASAALVRSRFPELSAANTVNRLIRTAYDRGPRGRDAEFGFGLVNPVSALTTVIRPVTRSPLLLTGNGGPTGQAGPALSTAPSPPSPSTPPPSTTPTAEPSRSLVSQLEPITVGALATAAGMGLVAMLLLGGAGVVRRRRIRHAGPPARTGWDAPVVHRGWDAPPRRPPPPDRPSPPDRLSPVAPSPRIHDPRG